MVASSSSFSSSKATTTFRRSHHVLVVVVASLILLPTATDAWDFWTILLNFIGRGPIPCRGPLGVPNEYHDLCRQCAGPLQKNMCACEILCNKYDESSSDKFYGKKAYEFCEARDDMMSEDSSSATSICTTSDNGETVVYVQGDEAAAVEGGSEYVGESSGGVGVVSDMAKRFQWWMLAAGAAVVMALVAVVLGQRKENRQKRQERAVLSGAVGRRLNAVSAFADGVLPVRNRTHNVNAAGEQVEMSGYKLDYDDDDQPATRAPSTVGSLSSSDEEGGASVGGYESAYA